MVGVSEEVANAEFSRDDEVVACAIQAGDMADAVIIAEKEKTKLNARDARVSVRGAAASVATAENTRPKRLRGKRGSAGI